MTTEPPTSIRVLVVDDHPVVRLGLASVLDAQPDIAVVGQASSGEEAIALYESILPDVTLMDLRLPGIDGVVATARIRARWAEARVIVLSTFGAGNDIHRAIEAGAACYLLKDSGAADLLAAVRAIFAGRRWLPPEVERRLAERSRLPALSSREVEVLEALSHGLSNHQIAIVLGVSDDTVKYHLKRLFTKMGVADRVEAVVMALQQNLLRPP